MIERVLQATKEAGISVGTAFIFGDAEESMETVNNTMQWVRQNCYLMATFSFNPIILYPGSQLYRDAVENNIIGPIEHLRKCCPPVNVSKLSDEEYEDLIVRLRFEAAVIFARMANVTFEVYYVDDKLKRILDNGKCAIWPASNHFAKVYEYGDALKNASYELINADERVTSYFGKTVMHPSRLGAEIDTIVVFSRFYKDILYDICMKYDCKHLNIVMYHELGRS